MKSLGIRWRLPGVHLNGLTFARPRPRPQRKNERSKRTECETSTTSPLPRPIWTPAKVVPYRPRRRSCAHLSTGAHRRQSRPGRTARSGRTRQGGARRLIQYHHRAGDGQELTYYWCDDGIALMAACDAGRAAELQPRTVLLMDRATYAEYCATHPRPGPG